MNRCNECPLLEYCLTQKAEHESCEEMIRRYNANLLLSPYHCERSVMQ